MAADELLTTSQVCAQYPVFNPGTLRYWRSANVGPESFSLGQRGRIVYRRSEIERWLAEQEAATKRGGAEPDPPDDERDSIRGSSSTNPAVVGTPRPNARTRSGKTLSPPAGDAA